MNAKFTVLERVTIVLLLFWKLSHLSTRIVNMYSERDLKEKDDFETELPKFRGSTAV